MKDEPLYVVEVRYILTWELILKLSPMKKETAIVWADHYQDKYPRDHIIAYAAPVEAEEELCISAH